MIWIKLLIAVIIVEALAEILTESRVTDFLRRLPGLLGYFFGCGYCASVWLGVGAAYLLRMEGALEGLGAVEPVLWGVVVHRGSNVLHEAISRFMGRVPWALFLNVRGAVPMDLQIPVENESTGTGSSSITTEVTLDLDGETISRAASLASPPDSDLPVIDADEQADKEQAEQDPQDEGSTDEDEERADGGSE